MVQFPHMQTILVFLLLSACYGMQYINIISPVSPTEDIQNWILSNTTFTDDSPFQRVDLPFDFLFFDRYQQHVWISPNGMISFAPGVPCDCCFNGNSCSLNTFDYQALVAPYLSDLNPLHFNNSAILYGWDANRFVVKWENVPPFDMGNKPLSFQLVLYRDGSISFTYKSIIIPMPPTYDIPAGIIGIRPFYGYSNYTRRSPIKSSFQSSWSTTIPGSYANPSYLSYISSILPAPSATQSLTQPYLYSKSIVWCLAPTTLCVQPRYVGNEETLIHLSFSLFTCKSSLGSNSSAEIDYSSSLLFRCQFYNSVYSDAILNTITHEFTCVKPSFSCPSNQTTITVALQYASKSYPNYWTVLETTTTPLTLSCNPSSSSSSSSSFPFTCDLNSTLTCSRCGVCTADNTTANLCIGTNGDLFGPMTTDCPEGTIEDRNGYCCPEKQLNCAGFCSTWYVEARDSTNSYPVCCFVDHVDCMGLCNGAASMDMCGVCSGGLTNHKANSDMDCLGVCFGNYTENCLLNLKMNLTEIDAIIDLTKSETETTVQFEITNESPFYGSIHSHPTISNTSPPEVFLSLTKTNQLGQVIHVPQDMMPGFAKLIVSVRVSVYGLFYNSQIYQHSRDFIDLNYIFSSIGSNKEPALSSISIRVNFKTKGCQVLKRASSCSRFPGCMSCIFSGYSSGNNYIHNRNFFSLHSNNALFSFTKLYDFAPEYLSCTDNNQEDTCRPILNFLSNRGGLQGLSENSTLNSLYWILVFFILSLIIIVMFDIWKVYNTYKFNRYLWLLYLEDHSQYREIISIFMEEQEAGGQASSSSNQEDEEGGEN